MGKIERLARSYEDYIRVPWQQDVAPSQRVLYCIYDAHDELRLRSMMAEFELATQRADHQWVLCDLTDTFAGWLDGQKYATSYFQRPELLTTLLPRYADAVIEQIGALVREKAATPNAVVALQGIGSLFGLSKVNPIVTRTAPLVPGRFLVFFPGSCEKNNYRLLDAYDGWDYRAVPITVDNSTW